MSRSPTSPNIAVCPVTTKNEPIPISKKIRACMLASSCRVAPKPSCRNVRTYTIRARKILKMGKTVPLTKATKSPTRRRHRSGRLYINSLGNICASYFLRTSSCSFFSFFSFYSFVSSLVWGCASVSSFLASSTIGSTSETFLGLISIYLSSSSFFKPRNLSRSSNRPCSLRVPSWRTKILCAPMIVLIRWAIDMVVRF